LDIAMEIVHPINAVRTPKDDLEAAGMGYAILVGEDLDALERRFAALIKRS
jgi:hypothetical protein